MTAGPHDGRRAAIAAGAVHAAVALLAVTLGLSGSSEWYDQTHYHLPVIERFAAELPSPNLADYRSATTPGYHLLLALAMRTGLGIFGLHIVNAAFGVALVATVAWFVGARAGRRLGVAAGAVVGLSPYVVSGSVWLNTDNLGLLLVVLCMIAALPLASGDGASSPVRAVARGAGLAAIAVFIRQILAYAAAIPAAALVARAIAERRLPRLRDALLGAAAMLPALGLVAAFLGLWGGLVPPSFREYHGAGANPVTPVYALALVGVWGTAAFWGVPGFLGELRSRRIAMVALVAGAVAAIVESDFVQHVRWGGVLWSVVKIAPAPMGRSAVLVPLAAIGAASIGAFLRVMLVGRREPGVGAALLPLLVLAGAIAAQTANQQCFERYLQPIVTISCVMSAVLFAGPAMRAWPLAAAACVAAGLTALNVFRTG